MNFCTERVGLVIPEHTQMIFKEYKYLYIYINVYMVPCTNENF